LPLGGLLALQVQGKLRNPSRPGKCSGPCQNLDGTLNPTLETLDRYKYTMELIHKP